MEVAFSKAKIICLAAKFYPLGQQCRCLKIPDPLKTWGCGFDSHGFHFIVLENLQLLLDAHQRKNWMKEKWPSEVMPGGI